MYWPFALLPVLQSIWQSSPRWLPSMTRSSATIWMRLASSQMYVFPERICSDRFITPHWQCTLFSVVSLSLVWTWMYPVYSAAWVAFSPWSSSGDICLLGGLNDCPLPDSAYFFCFLHFAFCLHSCARWMTRLKSLWGFSQRADE